MVKVILAKRARSQITKTLRYTLEKFGQSKRKEYSDLIQLALSALAENPQAGKQRPDIHSDAWTYHVARKGQKARHLFIYKIKENVEIAHFLYDGMDLPRHWSDDQS